MEARLVELARLLRRHGVPTSPTEVADAVRATALVGLEGPASLRAALRATLVKRAADQPTFDAIFDLTFSGLGRVVAAAERSVVEALRESGLLEGDELEMVIRRLGVAAARLGPLGEAALAGGRARVLQLLRAAALRIDLSLLAEAGGGFAARRLVEAAGGAALEADRAAAEAALREAGAEAALPPPQLDALAGTLREAFEGVERAAQAWAREALAARAPIAHPDRLGPGPGGSAGGRLEAAQVEVAVRRLARRLEARLRRRDRSRRRGALSLRRTLRRNLGLDGVPARLVLTRLRPERPELLVLCDVSESVRPTTRLMLLFLHALQASARRSRTFLFVDRLGEVTATLRDERDPVRAADLALASGAVPLGGNSAYGRVLRELHRSHLAAVTRRTTVVVIGDGRSNYAPPEAWVLAALRRRARRVLWICTEPRGRWGQGDSEMPAYARHCDRVATVERLADLESIADALVPP